MGYKTSIQLLLLGLCITIPGLSGLPTVSPNNTDLLANEKGSEGESLVSSDPACMIVEQQVEGHPNLMQQQCTARTNTSNVKCVPGHVHYTYLSTEDVIANHSECIDISNHGCKPFYQKRTYFEGRRYNTSITVGRCYEESCNCSIGMALRPVRPADPFGSIVNPRVEEETNEPIQFPNGKLVTIKNSTSCICAHTCHRVQNIVMLGPNQIDVGKCEGTTSEYIDNVCLPYNLQRADTYEDLTKFIFSKPKCQATNTSTSTVECNGVNYNVKIIHECQCSAIKF